MRWFPWIIGVALLVLVIVAARHFSAAEDFARLTERAQPWWLGLAVVLQLATYLAQGQVFHCVARAGHFSLHLATACRLGFAKLFVDQAVPSAGLSGTVVLTNGLQRRGIAQPLVAAAVVIDLASYYAVYVLCLGVALVITAARGKASALIVLVALVFCSFAVGFGILVVALSGRGARTTPRLLRRLRPVRTVLAFIAHADGHLARSPRVLFETSAYQLAIVLCDAATIWVLIRSLGGDGSAGGVFASFMISSLFRTIGILPGGLGTYEAAAVVTLRMADVPLALALAATLLFRGLSFWLPLLPGLWFSRREL